MTFLLSSYFLPASDRMRLLRHIAHSGLSVGDPYHNKRSILLSNYLSLILCCGVIIVILSRVFIFRDPEPLRNLFVGLVVFAMPICLNRLSFTVASRLFLCWGTVGFVWYAFIEIMLKKGLIEVTMYDGLRIYLLAMSILPYLLFDRRRPVVFFLGILPSLVSVIFLENIMTFAGLDPATHGIGGGDYQFMQMRTIVAYLIITSGCIAFQAIITSNDAFNQRILSELREKTEEIETQNDELVLKQESLNEMNRQLETLVAQKTENIEKQNERLVRFAYSNAHYLRGPVARLLGLIQLFRMKTDLTATWFFEKVANEAEAIDSITREIAKDLDDSEIDIPDEIEKMADRDSSR